MLGRIYKTKGDRVKALQNFTIALSLDPKARFPVQNGITYRLVISSESKSEVWTNP